MHKKARAQFIAILTEGQAPITTSQTEIPPSSPQQDMWKYLITPWCKGHLLHYTLDLQTIQGLQKKSLIFKKLLPQYTPVFQELTSKQNLAWKRREAGKKRVSGPCNHKPALNPPKGSKDIPKILQEWEASCQPNQKSISPVFMLLMANPTWAILRASFTMEFSPKWL